MAPVASTFAPASLLEQVENESAFNGLPTSLPPPPVPMLAKPAVAQPFNLAELLARLGGISPERVRLYPPPGTAVEEDVLLADKYVPNRPTCELIDGVLVEKTVGFTKSILAGAFIELLRRFAREGNLGIVAGADGTVRLAVGNVRAPDVAFVSWDRCPGRMTPQAPLPALVPDLAIEILSVSNTPGEMQRKRQDYFTAGVRLVWEVDPRTRVVAIYTTVENLVVLRETDTLSGGDVLPGFALPLANLFAELDRHG